MEPRNNPPNRIVSFFQHPYTIYGICIVCIALAWYATTKIDTAVETCNEFWEEVLEEYSCGYEPTTTVPNLNINWSVKEHGS